MTASLVDLLLESSARAPDKVALRRQHSAWTYSDLTRGAAAAAATLGEAGLEPGDRVGLLFRNGPEYVAFFYGALAARLSVVPLNVQERATVLALQVAHSGARLVVGDPDHPEWRALRSALPPDFPMLAVTCRDAVDSATAFLDTLRTRTVRPLEPPDVARDDLAMLLYTSGTTGRPKGVMLSHGAIIAAARNINAFVGNAPGDREVAPLPLSHSFGLGRLRCQVLAGGALLLVDGFAMPGRLFNMMERYEAAGLSSVPAGFEVILRTTGNRLADFAERLRWIEIGSAAMPMPRKQQLMRLLPKTRLCMHYGLTEASPVTHGNPLYGDSRIGTVGIPWPDTEAKIVDVETGSVAVPIPVADSSTMPEPLMFCAAPLLSTIAPATAGMPPFAVGAAADLGHGLAVERGIA